MLSFKGISLVFLIYLVHFNVCLGQDNFVKMEKGIHPIKEILSRIQKQTDIMLFYSNETVRDNMLFEVKESPVALERLMSEMLPPHGLGIKSMSDKVYAIYSITSKGNYSDRKNIDGLVVDSLGKAIEFASIRVFEPEGKLMAIYNTDRDGGFTLRENFTEGKVYPIQISALGYATANINFNIQDQNILRRIVLHHNQIQIKTVAVKATRRPFERVADRLIVQVEGSILDNGLSTLEILQRSPGLWVDPNGGIRLRGNQGVQVMINDIVQRMSGEQLAEYLRNLPSESISKIEIIPNPAAEYEAAGTAGIIRIVLRKNSLDGFRANLMGRYMQQVKDPYYNVGTIMDFKKRKLMLTAVAGYLRNDESIFASNEITYADHSKYISTTDRYRESKSYNGRVTAIYDLHDAHSLGFQSVWTKNNTDQGFYTDNTHYQKIDTLLKTTYNNWITNPTQFSNTLNYTWKRDSLGSTFKLITDYVSSQHQEENRYTLQDLNSLAKEQYINYSPNNTSIYSIQTDWLQYYHAPFNWLAGLKYIGTRRDNEVLRQNLKDGHWIKDEQFSNEYLYNENLLMGYVALNYKKNKTALKVGLRAEETYVHAQNLTSGAKVNQQYLNLFPSLFLQHEIRGEHSLYLNYAKRINRPSFKNLNPYTLQIDDFILLKGNSALKPELVNRVEAGIQLKNNSTMDVFYSYTKDKMALFTETVDNKMLLYQSRNFPNSIDVGFNIFVPWKWNAWWSGQANMTGYKNWFKMVERDFSQETLEMGLSQMAKIKGFDNALYLSYRTPQTIANTKYSDQFYAAWTTSKRVFKDKGKISFSINDLFNTARESELTTQSGTIVDFYQKRPTRTFSVSLTYILSRGKKIYDKKIEESNKEVKNRAN